MMALWRLPWLILGLASAGLGILGVVLPLVPTTPFLLLSAYGFSRSSPRLHRWLVEHPRLGPPIRHWRAHRAISKRAKGLALVAIAATLLTSVALGVAAGILAVQAVVLTIVTGFILTRPSPPDDDRPRARRSTKGDAPCRP
jgi:uncharacterized protein